MGLFDIFNKLPKLNEITGSFGEWLAKTYAKTIPGALVINDVLVDGDDGYTSQIDMIIVGGKGIYVIEIKMYTDAKIYGDMKRSKWSYYNHGNKYEIYSPVSQNKKHVEYVKKFLRDFGDIPVFSIITMVCDDFKISGDRIENTIVCNSLPAMERALYTVSENMPIVFDENQQKKIFEYIKNNQHIGKDARREHKERVIRYKQELNEMKNVKICPYCKTEMLLRKGKNGEFYGCSNFPKCRYTLNK